MNRDKLEQAVDSGIVNEYIEAYCLCTLFAMNTSRKDMEMAKGVLRSIMMDTPAAAALELAKHLLPEKKPAGHARNKTRAIL